MNDKSMGNYDSIIGIFVKVILFSSHHGYIGIYEFTLKHTLYGLDVYCITKSSIRHILRSFCLTVFECFVFIDAQTCSMLGLSHHCGAFTRYDEYR